MQPHLGEDHSWIDRLSAGITDLRPHACSQSPQLGWPPVPGTDVHGAYSAQQVPGSNLAPFMLTTYDQ